MIVSLKNVVTPNEQYKARFVAQGHTDPDSIFQIHFPPTIKHTSIRNQLTIAASNDEEAVSANVEQAFRQGSIPKRTIYIRPTK